MSKEIIDHGFGVIETRETFYTEETMRQKDQKIADLEAKLAESESRFQAHKQTDARTIQYQGDLISELKQQLAEKENGQNQKAIDELENTRNIVEEVLDKALKNSSLNQKYYDELLDFIDEQINELKGEMKLSRERLKTLLYNAIVLLEDCCGAVMNTDLELELGITQEEYDEIMG